MFEMIIMVNKTEGSAYSSGNDQFFDVDKAKLYEVITNTSKHSSNNNFLEWASRFNDLNDLHFEFVSSGTKGEAKDKSITRMKDQGWTEISLLTKEKTEAR